MKKSSSVFASTDPISKWFIAIFIFLHFSVGSSQVPAMFIFGDSLVDNGNNNNLQTLARANYYPYGIDFQGPTGRFCNGRTIIDMLCEKLGLPYLPHYADQYTRGSRLLNGVNYASAAGGILDETGRHLGARFSLNQQVLNFETNLNDLRNLMDARNLTTFLAKSIVIIVFGSNDYINNYLLPNLYSSSYNYNPQDYADLLLNHYTRQILALNSVGLRKFLLAGVGPLGCIPNQLATGAAPPGWCVNSVNQIVGPFNVGLRSLVDQLNSNHAQAVFVYGNTYGALGDMLNNPTTFGFSVINAGCCGIGRNQGQITCLPLQVPCANRNQYLFWDAFHPSEAANEFIALRAYSGPPNDCYPINVQQMAQI